MGNTAGDLLAHLIVAISRRRRSSLRISRCSLRAVGVTRRLDSPLVGRRRAFAKLRESFDRTIGDRAGRYARRK